MSVERPEEAIEEEAVASESEETPAEGGPDELAEARAKADENWERYVRAVAETENVRKRAARDVENAHKYALERFGKELLAVIDGLEMALAAPDTATAESLLEGNRATLKLLGSTMERFGISAIDPEGEPFDPEFHEAITMQQSETAEPGSVLAVMQKGYVLNGRLIRPAMVVVAED